MNKEKNHQILIVEDDFSMRTLLKKILEKEGYDIFEADEGEQALNCLKQNPGVSLIIADIRMPKKDGMALLKDVTEHHPEIRVILITAFGEVNQYLDAMNTGAFEYLNKPFKNQEILDLTKRALQE